MEQTVSELLGRAPSDGVSLIADGKEYGEETFYTTCHKTANLLNHLGLREGGDLFLVPSSRPEAFFGFLGGAFVGATVRFERDTEGSPDVFFCPVEEVRGYNLAPSCSVIVYGDGDVPTGHTSFEREIWGENPVFPHELRGGGDAEVLDGTTSGELIEEAREVVEKRGLWNGDEVQLERIGEKTAPEVVAGVIARATVVVESSR